MKSKKLVLNKPYGTFELVTQELSTELQMRSILLKTELVGICATDTHIYKGALESITYPVVLGHEFVGTIHKKGAGITHDSAGVPVETGDRIIPMPATPCYACSQCFLADGPLIACENYDVTGFSQDQEGSFKGGFSEYIELHNPNTRFFKSELAPHIAVLAEPFCTPIHGVQRIGITLSDSVLIQGSGAVGILAIAAVRAAGAKHVIVIGGPPKRLELCKKFGAQHVIDISEIEDSHKRVQEVLRITRGRGVDVAIEAAGVASALPEGIACLRNGGRYLELGCFADVGEVSLNPHKMLLANNITLKGSSGYGASHFLQAIKILEMGHFPFEELVSHRLPLKDAEQGIKALLPENKWSIDGVEAFKITIDPSQ